MITYVYIMITTLRLMTEVMHKSIKGYFLIEFDNLFIKTKFQLLINDNYTDVTISNLFQLLQLQCHHMHNSHHIKL